MKNVKSLKNSLKFKATPKTGVLTVRVGVKKFVLPVDARMISGDGYLFLSFGSSSEIYEVGPKSLTPLAPEADGAAAAAALTPKSRGRGRAKRSRKSVEMPDNLAKALAQVPAGYKLVPGDGGYRLVRTRVRKK
ncbi:MAG: hypothetical protein IT363_00320 [Methanoregulaceae archaeon]|nr:hypothetical protein [Methanoregulaceae archaeon]